MKKECFISIGSIGRIADFKDGKVRGIAIHNDGSYDYQVVPVSPRPIETFQMKLRKVRTYEEALVIIKEAGRLRG